MAAHLRGHGNGWLQPNRTFDEVTRFLHNYNLIFPVPAPFATHGLLGKIFGHAIVTVYDSGASLNPSLQLRISIEAGILDVTSHGCLASPLYNYDRKQHKIVLL
jgi:hypothetical protein